MSDNTSYFDLYKALKADGAVQGDWGSFHKFVGAPGKQGYLNRKKLYDALKADGAVQSNTYEEFNMKLFRGGQARLKAAKQRQAVNSQSQQQKPSKPQTTAQMAMSQGYKQPTTATPTGTDYMQNWQLMHKRNDQMNPTERMQANTMRSRMQQAQKQATQQEQRRTNPISQSRVTPNAQNFNETMQQLATPQAQRARAVQQRVDDATNLAEYEITGNNFVHNDGKQGTISPEIDSLVAPSMKEADDLSWSQYQQDLKKAGNDAYLRNKAWKDLQDNRIKNRQNVLADNLSAKLQEIYSQKGLQEHIIQSADKLNMGVEEYVDKYVTPQMMQRAQNILGVKNIEEVLPQSATEYVTRRLSDSIMGTLSAGQDKSREQIAREQEAMAIADGLEEMPTVNGYKANEGYKSGVGARFVSTAANMAMDSPILGMTGSGANLTVDLGKQVLMKGLAKAGLVKAGAKLTTQQLAFKAANMTMAQKIASGLVEGTAKSALNLGGYSSITAALGQASTGDDTSLSALGQAALGGFEHGATTGAMFGVSGAIMAPWVSKFGITSLEKSTGEKWLHGTQKLGATAAGLGVEAGTMMVADNITGDKDISVGTWLEDLVMVGAFKAGEPKNYGNIGRALYGLTHNTNNTFRVGKDSNGNWRTVDIRMTKDEQGELMNSASGKNLVEAFQKVDKSSLNSKTPLDKSITKLAYEDFMKDPNVSQSTKEKVNAAMGLFNTTSDRSYRSVNDVQNKQILEYSKNGTLLTRTSYKNADERRAILYKQKLYRDNEEMRSLAGYSKLKDLQLTDENGEVTKLALGFLVDKGYNVNENAAEANNARLVASLRDKNSDLYKEWEQYVNRHGMLGELISENGTFDSSIMAGIKDMLGLKDARINLDTIMRKDPMKRTDQENKIFYAVKNQLEAELFPNGKPHAEQSETQGRNVAEDNNLGTEQPNSQPVMDELRNLRAAEQALEQAMDGNDVFKQVFEQCQKQGIRPVDAYDVLIQNGLTQEEIAPLADYINANARVQGMQTATQQAIEEHVGARVSDWSYKGSLNGGNEIPMGMDASKMLYVNWNGKTYIVGNGDVSFDSTGRAKEDVGDMLVCLDPETNTMEYIPTREVTFGGTESANDYAAKYREQLQMINSQPYNAAAQEQAMQDAAKPQSKEEAQQKPENDGANAGVESRPQNAPKNDVSSDNQEVKPDQAPGQKEQPQQVRKFADGTDVPMTKDSKGRPTPDYGSMKPEQAAEILTQDFGENAEKVVDGQVKKAEKALKNAEDMKVDYSAEPNDILEQEQVKAQTIEAAKQQLEQAQNIRKAMTAKKVAETVAKPSESEKVDEANQASPIVREKFDGSKKVAGRRGSITLPGGKKIRGTYYYGETSGLTPSHDPFSDFKQNEGFPVNEDGTTANSRSYKDKGARQFTEQIGNNFNGLALKNVPVVQDGVVLSGNGTTMAKLLAERNGKDGQYREDLNDNIEGFGLTPEKIAKVGDKGIVYFVPDEKFPLSSKTFDMFNKRETKSESNTEQAVAKAKTLTADEVGAIVADIEGNGSLDAFFNNSKAINDLVRTLVDKGIIGQNEVDGFMDGTERLSAQGKEYVKNLLLGSVFKPETIRMLGIDGKIKNAAINGIRAIMDNLKLGDYSLRDELDQAIQLLYEARRSKMSVEDLLRQNSAFDENARDRFPMIAQAMAQALEGRTSTFRELMNEYNDIAKNYNTSEGTLDFYDKLTPEQLVDEFLNASKAIKNNNIKLYGKDSETESGNDAASNEEPAKEAGGAVGTEGNEPAATEPEIKVKKALKRIATEITKQTGIEVVTDDKVGQSALEDAEATDSNVKFHKETDEEVLNALNSGETIKVYRAMQVIDGKLYPPMAASVGGKLVEANELGVWIRADENPDLAIPDIDPKTGKQKVDKKTGEPKWKFKLDKGGKDATGKKATDVNAAYNPYWHMSRSPLNDQFKSAWIRPNIVVVECEVPVSELTSGYKAERAKDAVGEVDWKSGSVSGEVFKQTGRARKVILSRWCKPVRVLDDAEVAQRAKEFIGEAKVEIPENVLTPKQRIAFEEAGFKIGAPEKGVKKSEQILEALEKGLQIDNSVREQRGSRWAGGEVLGMKNLPKELQMNPSELASEITQYHGDYISRILDESPEDSTASFASAHNGTWYIYSVDKTDRSINVFEAIPASRKNFEQFKEIINQYGFNTETEDIYSNLQKIGRSNRSDSDLLDSFLRGGTRRDYRVHSGETSSKWNDGTLGMAGDSRETTKERVSPEKGRVRQFRSANGEVYGFTVDGKIYLDTKKMKPETPLHEYTHLWTEALRNSNPTEWENVKGLFDEVEGLKEEVQKLYPELKGDDLYEEMITTFSGREGAKKLEEVVRGLAAEDGKTVEESAKASGFIGKVKEALKKYWKGVADILHIHFTSAEEVADKVLADWASGFNPRDFDDLHDKELEGRIKVTDEETETPSENGPITKQKILIDGDKEVTKVDEPNENGDYTGSYYEYDGKKFGDLREVADYIDGNAKSNKPLPVMPKPVEPTNPIEKAAEDYKKEHPLTEEELLNTTAFDDLPEDQKQYCIDAALDYLNGEDNSAIAEAYYRNAYEKRSVPSEGNKLPKPEQKNAQAEQKPLSSDPMEGLKNAAEGYEETKKAKSATERVKEILQTPRGQKPKTTSRKELEAERDAADNEFEAFMKELRKKRSGQLNSGFIDQNLVEAAPKMFSLAAKCAYTRIKLGMYDAKEVVKDLRERFKEAFDGFDKRDIETFYSQIMEQKWRDGDKRMSLNGWAEHYRKLSPEYKEKLEGDSKEAEERKANEDKFISNIGAKLLTRQKIEGIKQLRQIAKECGLEDVKDTDLQELAESAVVRIARGISGSNAMSEAQKFDTIKKLYEDQPSLNQRDSERVMKQQYSTPAPYAFLADMYVKGNGKEVKSALEPSAGNGMLTIGLPMDAVHVNDIDAQRLANLRRQGFKNVTSQDGTQPFADKDVDVVVTNPPFGSATPKEYDGYKIGSLEGQMAINALESMKDDGRAAIIIGGKTEYAKNGSLNPKDKAFLGYLYSHYNVEDVINVDGSLYAKQGTTYPTRIILINGRRLDENIFPPVKSKARAEAVKDYDELYKRISDDILRGERMDSSIKEGEGNARPELDRPSSADTHEEGVRAGGERGGEPSDKRGAEQSGEPSVSGADDVLENRPTADREPDGGLSGGDNSTDRTGTEPSQSEGTEARTNDGRVSEQGGAGRVDSEPSNDRPSASNRSGERPRGQLQRMDESVRGLSTEKVTYTPKSGNPFTLKAVMPSDQQEAVNKNLEKLGDADQFLVDELGYNDKDDLYSHLAAEQVDSVALALQQAKKGNAFIIGDMTGIGKGRQAASLIRYAKKQGQVPVYFTKTAGLLSDVYRDLVDIGSPELRPFVFGSAKEAAITDADGKVVFPLPPKNEVKRVLDYIEKNGELPKEYDYVLTTYSQVSNGIYEFDENGNRKERKIGKNKSFGAAAFSGQRRRDAIEKLMANGYLILDESHTAGGNSGQGNYFQHIIQKAKNVTFFSATFAKRPDNMPIYALRTAMNQGGLKASELIDAVKRGGATLQEIMSQTLTQCGQMIRRERDMTGVTIDWRAIDEPEKVKEQREQYDSIIGLFNDIINFQKTYVSHYVEDQNEAMAAMQASMGIKRGTEALGIKNVPFASKAFNTVQQVLLSLKAKSAAERAIDYLKQGMKPVIALNNTNESQTGNIALGEEMDAPDLGTSLRKGLEGTLRYTSKNAKDESSSGYIKLEDLGDDAVEAYHNLEKKIKETSTGLSLSPIDVIKNELEKAGYKVGELTGRSTEFVYNDNGTVTKVKRADTDKKKLAREFNDGQIDALILNKSAATGISLHASSKYKDQRKRVMIVAQQQLDVNDEVQMRGRIDRTGQVARGAYEYVVSLIPAEQRLLMMFKAKLKSLDANTTSSQKSKFNEMEVADITNKYGDKVVREYMAEHLDLYSRMADPFGWEKEFGDDLSSISTQNLVVTKSGLGDGEAGADASKLLGRMALLKVEEQEKMLNEIGELYANEIQRLNEMGENDLEITELPLKAKTIRKEVWKQGSEPGGDNAFADNTYIEKVNMAILKKPMKAEEVKKAQDGLTGGKSWDEYRESKKAEVKNFFDQKIADETQKYEERAVKAANKAKEKYQKDAKKGQKDSGMSDEQIEKMAGYQYDNIYKQEKEKLNDVVKNLNAKAEMFDRVLDTFNTEDAYVLPVDMNKPDELSGFGNSYGRLIDIKITDNFSPNASSVSFATLDGRRKITFPIAGKVGSGDSKADVIGAIYRMTRQASGTGDKQLRVLSMDVNNWDRLVSNESRKDGYIVTGNLMQALIDSKNQGVGGQLVKYTTDTGEVKTGILMPYRFKPTDVANEYPISTKADALEKPSFDGGVEEVVSSDGDIKVTYKHDIYTGRTHYELRVPKSKAKGGKFFLDKDLLSMVNGNNFESRGNSMLGILNPDQLRPALARLSNLGVKVREERKSSEDDTHYRTANGEQGNDAQSIVANHIANVSEKVGGKVNMVNSVDEITNPRVKADIEAGKNVTGWYDEKTGEVHLCMPNIHDRYTAEKTIWHEVVGHKGMRELLGEDGFRKFIREVWDNLDKPEYASLKKLVDEERRYNPFGIADAIEEGIARLAEEGRGDAGLWNSIKNKVSDFLHEIGYRLAPNTKDVKYLLWLSKNLQKNPNDPYYKMRAEAVKYRLDHEDIPAMTEHDGMFHDNDSRIYKGLGDLPKAEYQEATDGQIHFRTTPSAGTALDRYHRSLDAHGYMFTESYMDNMLSLKNLMTAIVPGVKIEDIASSENPYILQNTMQGAMSDAAQMFERNVMKPLDKAMAQVLDAFDGKKDDEKIRKFNLYMITKHGLERNRILYVRDTLKAMRMDEKTKQLADTIEFDWNNEKARLDEELERGDIDLKEYYSQMDDFIRTYVDSENKFDAGEHDYSGIHAIQEIEKSSDPYDDAAAIASVMDSESKMEDIKKGSVADYWNKVKAATQYSLDTDYKNGLISRELYGHVSGMFNWYVPLRKYDEAAAEDTYGYITEKGDPKSYIGSTIMRARGHKYLSETNVLAQIGAMGNRAINNGGKNAIKQAFARFIRNHSNNNLVTETSVWYVSDPITQTTVERYPDIPEDATPDEISQIVADFNMEMKDLESKGLATKVYRRGRIGYKFQRAENKSQHIVDVMIAGKKHSFIVNGNPRAAQALNGLLEHKNETGIGKIAGKISRIMAQTCTSYNPEFVMRNMMRDFEFASSNLLAKEGARYTGVFEKYYAKVGIIDGIRNSKLSDFKDTGGFGLFAKYRNGTLDTSDKIQRYFKEFMENGGETGWVQIKDMKEWTEEYKRNIKAERNKASKIGKGFYNVIFKNLENVNEIAENMARFATYCASRDYGRSAVRSTYDAKEVSTNFNRHGSGSEIKSFKNGEMGGFQNFRKNTYRFTSAWFRNTSMFFNAGIQSTNLLVKNLKNNTAGTLGYIASGPMISGMAMALLNNFLIANEDEKDRKGVKDPYGELPDYIRRNNLCVYVGEGEFVTIPLAIEERAFYGLGDLAAGLTFSPNVSGQKNPFLDAVGCMSQLVPVADYLGNSSFGKHPVQETIKAVMPSATSPFIEWAYNSDWKGAPIERDDKFDENQPAWMLAYKGTPDLLIDLNKKVNAYTNDVAKGNEDMKGNDFLDAVTNPSGLQHFYSSYLGGAATFAERSIGLIKNGGETETKDIPFVRSLFYTPSEQSSLQRTKSKWYNYKDEMETTIANVDRLKSKNVPIDKRIANIGDYYNFQNSKDAAKVRVIELAEKQMKQWKKLRDKSGDTESIKNANENIDRIMMEAVEQLDKLN